VLIEVLVGSEELGNLFEVRGYSKRDTSDASIGFDFDPQNDRGQCAVLDSVSWHSKDLTLTLTSSESMELSFLSHPPSQ
jgi:hypothetical protein